jgi:hypothetical protein
MIYNMHATWAGSGQGAGIRMGRSGGVASGAWYQVATMDSNEFMIAKNGQWANGGIKITDGGVLYYGNTGYRYIWESGTWGISISGSAVNLYGGGGSTIRSSSVGTSYTANYQVRENDGGYGNTDINYAPQLAFHWGNVVASSILMESSGRISIRNNPGTGYEDFIANIVYGAASVRAPIFYDSADTSYYLDPNSTSNLYSVYAYAYRGNGNVDGTGSASYHPSGIYSTGNNWLYGTLYMAGNNMRSIGGIVQNDLMGRPNAQWGAGGSSTGAVIIKFPGNTDNYGMVHAVIDIYEYNGNNVSTIIVGGHNWGSQWYSYGANVVGYTNKQVRVGVKDGKYCIIIGDGSSTWSYGQVVLRKIQNGAYYSGVMDVGAGYTIAIESDTYSWVSGDLRTFRSSGNMYMNENLVATQSWVNSQGFVTGGPFLPLAGGTVTGTTNFNAGVNFASQTNWFGGYGPGSGPGIALENISTFARFAFWGLDFYDWNHGIQMTLDNGYVSVNNYLQAGNSLRAPIFYDSNDTTYYLDPNSTSNLWDMRLLNGKWYTVNNNSGNSVDIYVRPNADNTYVWRHIYGGTSTGYGTGAGGYGIYNQTLGGDYSAIFSSSGYVVFPYSARSPIFYDSQDTAYYLDPNSTSNLYTVISVETKARKNQSDNNYTTAALWTESYGGTTTGIAFHISGNVGKFLEMRTNGVLYWENNPVITSGNYTSYAVPTSGYTFGTAFTIGTMYVSTGIQGSGLSYVLGTYSNGYTYRFDSTAFSSWIGLGNYLPLSGGTMTGQIYGPSVGSDAYGGLIQVRERGYVSNSQSDWSYSPAITFHWGNRFAKRLGFDYDGYLAVDNVRYLNASNYNSYAPTLTGGGASGTWGINVNGYSAYLSDNNASVSDGFVAWNSYDDTTNNPANSWWYGMRVSHGDALSYYSLTISSSFFSNQIYYRRIQGGIAQAWIKFMDELNSPYAYNMNQYVRTTDSPTFFGTLSLSADNGVNYTGSRMWLYSHSSYRGSGVYMSLNGGNSTWYAGSPYTDFSGYYMIGYIASTGSDAAADPANRKWQVSPSGNTYQTGSATATAFFEISDARLKTIVDEDYRVDSIVAIKPKFYQKNGKFEAGYIAQEVEGVYEHAVNLGDDGYLSLSYTQIHTLKIAALEDSVDDIKKKIKELEEKLNTLY